MKPSHCVLAAALLALLCQVAVATQYVPVSKEPVGIFYGNQTGTIRIQLIYDPVCYNTLNFDKNVTRRLEKELDPKVLSKISWRMVGQAKPWHTTALKILQGIRHVRDNKNAETAVACFRYFLDNIADWDNTRINKETVNSYMDALAQQLSTLSGIPAGEIRPQLQHYSTQDGHARQEFKHTIGSRRCGLNPTIYVNDAKIDNGINLSFDEWKKMLTNLAE